jgi:hypothetical protein
VGLQGDILNLVACKKSFATKENSLVAMLGQTSVASGQENCMTACPQFAEYLQAIILSRVGVLWI